MGVLAEVGDGGRMGMGEKKTVLTPEQQEDQKWLISEISREANARGRTGKVTAKWTNNRWLCKIGNAKLSHANGESVRSRTLDVGKAMFRKRKTLSLEIAKPAHDIFWDLARLSAALQQELVHRMLSREHERSQAAPGTWAYRFAMGKDGMEPFVDNWMRKRAEYKLKIALKKFKEEETEASKGKRRRGPRVRNKTETKNKPVLEDFIWRPNSNLIAAITRAITEKYALWYATERGESAPPWPKANSFMLPDTCIHVESINGFYLVEKDGKKSRRKTDKVYVSVSMLGMKDGKRQIQPTFRLMPRGHNQWHAVRMLFESDPSISYNRHAATVKWDANVRRWYLNLCVSMPEGEAPKPDEPKVLVIRRGSFRWQVAMTSDGDRVTLYDKGEASHIIHIKQEEHARRNAKACHLHYQGRGARGHGRKRFFRIKNQSLDREARRIDTWIDKFVAHTDRMVGEMGFTDVVIEKHDESVPPTHPNPYVQKVIRQFPYATMRERLANKIEQRGVRVHVVSNDYKPVKCPKCGKNTDRKEKGDLRVCKSCRFTAYEDTIAMWHLLQAAGFQPKNVDETTANAARLRRAVKHKDYATWETEATQVAQSQWWVMEKPAPETPRVESDANDGR